MKILSPFAHPHVIPDVHDFLSFFSWTQRFLEKYSIFYTLTKGVIFWGGWTIPLMHVTGLIVNNSSLHVYFSCDMLT